MLAGKGIVAAVVGRHCHDGAGAVACKHIVADVDGYVAARDGVDGIGAAEHTAHLLVDQAFALGLVLHLVDVAVHGLALPGGGDQVYILALGSQHHEGDTKYRVGPRGEDGHLHVAVSHLKFHLGTLAVAYPVALGLLDRVAPVERVEVAQQAAGIGRHAQAPLVHHLLHHRVAATQRHPLAHLVVGQHCAQLGAPVHHGLAAVGDAVIHEHLLFLHLGEGLPLLGRELGVVAGGTGGRVAALAAVLLKVGHQLLDGAGLVEGGVVVALKHLEEGPLRPLVVLGVAGAHLAAPVEAEPYLVELLAVAVDVFHRGHLGVLPRLYGILLGRQPVGIIAHGVKHVVALQSLVAGIDVAGYIAQRVAHMQAGPAGVGKHVEHVVFGFALIDVHLIGVVVAPVLLPLLFDCVKIVIHISSLYLLFRSMCALHCPSRGIPWLAGVVNNHQL